MGVFKFPSGNKISDFRAAATEIETLYAEASGCTVCDETFEVTIGKIRRIDPVHQFDRRRGIRIIEVRRAFYKAMEHMASESGRPVNEALVSDVTDFFRYAALAKINTISELVNRLDVRGVTPDSIQDMAAMASAQRATNVNRCRELRRTGMR